MNGHAAFGSAIEPDLPIPVVPDTMPSVALRCELDVVKKHQSARRAVFMARPLSKPTTLCAFQKVQ